MRSLIVVLLALLVSPLSTAQSWQSVLTEGSLDPALHGVWQSRGYGWVLDATSADLTVYDVGAAGCIRNEEATQAFLYGDGLFSLDSGVLRTALAPQNSTQHMFDAISALPSSCDTPPGDSPREVFDYAWSVMNEHYAFFDLHGVDWDARYNELAPTITDDMSDADLRDALVALLAGLEDGHLGLAAEIDGQPVGYTGRGPRAISAAITDAFEAQDEMDSRRDFSIRWNRGNRHRLREEILGGEFKVDGPLLWGRIGDVGYLQISGMGGFAGDHDDVAYTDEMQALHEGMSRMLRDLDDTDGMIIDLVFNRGGYDEVSFAIASHFATEPTHAVTKYAKTHEADTRQTFSVLPCEPFYRQPVVLLTSDVTMSAAEGFVIAMRALPTVTHAGETTRGALSNVLYKPLPNGWMLSVSNEVYLDAEDELWERRGIEPEMPLDVFEGGNLKGHTDALLELADRLKRDE
ncbi:MAG: S41 family peptidase [Rubricoccaceae bacterium]